MVLYCVKAASASSKIRELQDQLRQSQQQNEQLKKQLATNAAVDEHLLDQLILPASLASGTSRLLGGFGGPRGRDAPHGASAGEARKREP